MFPKIYFYFCSSKRKEQHLEFMEFTEVEPLKILKHSTTRYVWYYFCQNQNHKTLLFQTELNIFYLNIMLVYFLRWLSLQKTVTRTLHHWQALWSYINSHELVETEGKVKRLAELFKRSDVKMYFFFLEFILGPLNEFNTTFQVSILFLISIQNKL